MNPLSAGLQAALGLAVLLGTGSAAVAQARSDAPPRPYQDRVMQIDSSDTQDAEPETRYDSSGLPRTWSLETFADSRSSAALGSNSTGLKLSGYTDTLHYGSFSGNFNLQQRSASTGAFGNANTGSGADSNFVLRQIGMPFDGGWRLDNALGLVNLPVTDLARLSQRVTLGTPAMQGLSSQFYKNDLGVVLAAGRAGQTQGYPVPTFTLANGQYSMAGLQQRFRGADGVWQWGGMIAQAQDVSSVLAQTPTGLGRLDADGAYLSARRDWVGTHDANGSSVQVNAVFSRNTGTALTGLPNAPASGLWLEGAFSRGAHRHDWGVFRLEPGLAWLDQPMAADLQGAYWRHAWTTRQWTVQSGLEMLGSLTGLTPNGFFANTNARYQYSTSTSFGGGFSARRYGVQAQAVQLYTQFVNGLGSSRAQLDLASAESGERVTRLQFDHDWTNISAARVTTSVSLDRESRATGDSQGQGVAINADWSIGNRLTLNQSLQGRWSNDATQYSLNAGLNWRIAPRWSLQTNVYAMQGTNNALNLAQSPLVVVAPATLNTNDSGVFVMLRYEESAGRAQAPSGAAPGSAAGRLTGSVFLDDNQNGKREAGEQGAVNVTVLLDGRYAMQTDAQGRFEFPYVAAGPHLLSVISDNLPLPWGLNKDGRTEVRVFTRDTTTADIGATRQ